MRHWTIPVKLKCRCKTQELLSAYAVKGYLMKVQKEFTLARLQLRNKNCRILSGEIILDGWLRFYTS